MADVMARIGRILDEVDDALVSASRAPLGADHRERLRTEWYDDYRSTGRLPSAATVAVEVLMERGSVPTVGVPRAKSARHPDSWRRYALAHLFAMDASQSPDVVAFRRAHLQGGLLPFTGQTISGWVNARAGRGAELLVFSDPDDGWVSRVRVDPGTPLDDLRRVSEQLSQTYPWPPDAAVALVLTGVCPWPDACAVSLQQKWPFPAAGRIVLTIDPMLTPDEVKQTYALAKREFMQVHAPTRGRTKRVGEHSAQLATFVMEAFAALPEMRLSRKDQWRKLRELRRDLPDAWRATPTYRRLARRKQAPRYDSDWAFWRDAEAVVEHLLFLRPVRHDRATVPAVTAPRERPR